MRAELAGRPLAVCYGAGVDSTALLVALKLADLRPDVITFADLVAEKPDTMAQIGVSPRGWIAVQPSPVCAKRILAITRIDHVDG